MTPDISIIMSAYRPERDGLLRTVDSVLNQTFNNFEFIIIKDDESSETLELLESIKEGDKRIKIIDNVKNIGLVKSLNKGLKEASAEYIARVDVDDWWEKDKLQLQYETISEDENLVIVGTQVNFVDTNLDRLNDIQAPLTDSEIKNHLLNGKNPFTHSSVLFKKLKDIYYNENAIHTEDFDLWCRYSMLGEMKNLQSRLTNYVVDLDSITGSKRYLMYVNATKVFENYMKSLKSSDKEPIYNGLINNPVVEMNYFDRLFSMYYSLGMKELFKNNRLKYYFYVLVSLLINPKVIYYILKRKILK